MATLPKSKLLYSSPALSTVHIKANTVRTASVLDDFLYSTSHARLCGGEGLSNDWSVHICFLSVRGGEPATCVLLIYLWYGISTRSVKPIRNFFRNGLVTVSGAGPDPLRRGEAGYFSLSRILDSCSITSGGAELIASWLIRLPSFQTSNGLVIG